MPLTPGTTGCGDAFLWFSKICTSPPQKHVFPRTQIWVYFYLSKQKNIKYFLNAKLSSSKSLAYLYWKHLGYLKKHDTHLEGMLWSSHWACYSQVRSPAGSQSKGSSRPEDFRKEKRNSTKKPESPRNAAATWNISDPHTLRCAMWNYEPSTHVGLVVTLKPHSHLRNAKWTGKKTKEESKGDEETLARGRSSAWRKRSEQWICPFAHLDSSATAADNSWE